MHGRLKVKTSAQQEAEKRKERNLKSKQYLQGVNKVFASRKDPLADRECFSISAQLLISNPDNLSLWNYRREFLLALKNIEGEDVWTSSLENELKVVENCLMKNHKSYGAWFHRDWVLRVIPVPPWKHELELCDKFLKLDERNFHCWDHRKMVVCRSNRDLSEELKFTQELIEKNFSNYSAWHYRSKLLPIVHSPGKDCPHPVEENIFIAELKKVVTAIFTDPSDQSPWFFLRWLLKKKHHSLRLVESGVLFISRKEATVVFVFGGPVDTSDLKDINLSIDQIDIRPTLWTPLANNLVWCASLEVDCNAKQLLCAFKEQSCFHDLTCMEEGSSSFKHISHLNNFILPELSQKSLNDIKSNCILLDALDPRNKWVLLTLVEVMNALSPKENLESISLYISQLKEIDPLRSNYYADLWSKITLSVALGDYVAQGSNTFSLVHSNLTRLVNTHELVSTKKIDLTGNLLNEVEFECLLACEELVLDQNKFLNLDNLAKLTRLKSLSLNGCNIESIDKLSFLSDLVSLDKLFLRDNSFSCIEMTKKDLNTLYSHIQEIYL